MRRLVWVLLGGLAAPGLAAQERATERPAAKAAPETLWTFDTKAPSYGSAAAGDIDGDGKPEVVFGTYFNDRHVYALNGEDGSLLWKFQTRRGPVDTSVLIGDVNGDQKAEVIFGDSAVGTLYCLNGKGKEVWTFRGQSGTDSPAAAADLDGDGHVEVVYGTMKTRDGQGRVNVLDGRTGKPVWTAKVPGHVQSEPGLVDLDGDGVLDVVVTNWMGDNRLRALNGKNGRELWTFETGDWVYHGVSFHDFDGDGKPEIVVADRKGTVWLLEGESGKKKWSAHLEGERRGSVFGPTSLVDTNRDGVPEIAVCGAHLHLLEARHGKVKWCHRYGGRSIARGAAVGDVNGDGRPDLVFGQGRVLRAVTARSGKKIWSRELKVGDHWYEGIDHAPLILDLDGDGLLDIFVVTGKGLTDKTRAENYGRAYALRAGKGRGRPHRGWLMFRGSPRHGGSAPTFRTRD